MKLNSIATVMIVKNEFKTIERSIASMRDLIDMWVILDTGSTDGTLELLHELAKDPTLPGFVYEAPFEDFSTSRNLVLDYGRLHAHWLIMMDADMEISTPKLMRKEILAESNLDVDGFLMEIEGGKISHYETVVFNAHSPWVYRRRTHEAPYLTDDSNPLLKRISAKSVHHFDGGSRANKYDRDLKLIQLDLIDYPLEPMNYMNLAGTQYALGNVKESLRNYRKALKLINDESDERTYVCLFLIASMLDHLHMADEIILDSFLNAALNRPWRSEARLQLYKKLYSLRRLKTIVELEEHFLKVDESEADCWFIQKFDHVSCLIIAAKSAHNLNLESKKREFLQYAKRCNSITILQKEQLSSLL